MKQIARVTLSGGNEDNRVQICGGAGLMVKSVCNCAYDMVPLLLQRDRMLFCLFACFLQIRALISCAAEEEWSKISKTKLQKVVVSFS